MIELSLILPCFNEEVNLPSVFSRVRQSLATLSNYEILLVDNGSTDRSAELAERLGARVVSEKSRGYGFACRRGLDEAQGTYLVLVDADDTYDYSQIPLVYTALYLQNYDFVTGSRFLSPGDSENIPLLHRKVGNPLLTLLCNRLYGSSFSDVYCGFRGFSKSTYQKIRPQSSGMEFNLELAINAHLLGLRCKEFPTALRPRKGNSKLRTFRDGFRSLHTLYKKNYHFRKSCPNPNSDREMMPVCGSGERITLK